MLDYAGFVENTFYLDIMCLVQYGECLEEKYLACITEECRLH